MSTNKHQNVSKDSQSLYKNTLQGAHPSDSDSLSSNLEFSFAVSFTNEVLLLSSNSGKQIRDEKRKAALFIPLSTNIYWTHTKDKALF